MPQNERDSTSRTPSGGLLLCVAVLVSLATSFLPLFRGSVDQESRSNKETSKARKDLEDS